MDSQGLAETQVQEYSENESIEETQFDAVFTQPEHDDKFNPFEEAMTQGMEESPKEESPAKAEAKVEVPLSDEFHQKASELRAKLAKGEVQPPTKAPEATKMPDNQEMPNVASKRVTFKDPPSSQKRNRDEDDDDEEQETKRCRVEFPAYSPPAPAYYQYALMSSGLTLPSGSLIYSRP